MVLVLCWPKTSGLNCVYWSLCSVLRFLVILLLCQENCDHNLLPSGYHPTFTFFWWSQLLAHVLSTHLNLTLSDFCICIYSAFLAWLLVCLLSLSHRSCTRSTLASLLPKSNYRPCQDCYLQPRHIPLWSVPFIFPHYSTWLLVPMIFWLFKAPLISWSFYLFTIPHLSISSFPFYLS